MPVFYRSRLDLNHHLLNDRFPIRHVTRSWNNPGLMPVFYHSRSDLNHHLLNEYSPIRHVTRSWNNPCFRLSCNALRGTIVSPLLNEMLTYSNRCYLFVLLYD